MHAVRERQRPSRVVVRAQNKLYCTGLSARRPDGVNGPTTASCFAAVIVPLNVVRAIAPRIDVSASVGELFSSLRCASTTCLRSRCHHLAREAPRLAGCSDARAATRCGACSDGGYGPFCSMSSSWFDSSTRMSSDSHALAMRARDVADVVEQPGARAGRRGSSTTNPTGSRASCGIARASSPSCRGKSSVAARRRRGGRALPRSSRVASPCRRVANSSQPQRFAADAAPLDVVGVLVRDQARRRSTPARCRSSSAGRRASACRTRSRSSMRVSVALDQHGVAAAAAAEHPELHAPRSTVQRAACTARVPARALRELDVPARHHARRRSRQNLSARYVVVRLAVAPRERRDRLRRHRAVHVRAGAEHACPS